MSFVSLVVWDSYPRSGSEICTRFGVLLALAVKLLGSYWFRDLVVGCLLVVVFWSFRVMGGMFSMFVLRKGKLTKI